MLLFIHAWFLPLETSDRVENAPANFSSAADAVSNTTIILPKVLVLYFPQFHRSPLNDKLWGDGFTDWENLRQAPLYNRKGYKIARPTTFGYYDLRNTTVRRLQGEMAREHGVDGFVYHHYWFYDEQRPGPTLHAPLVDMLQDGHPDIPFCLHWVAENWTATWHRRQGNDTVDKRSDKQRAQELLQKQFFPSNKSDARIRAHYKWLSQFFHHQNYIKVDGKPMFMVYRKEPGIHFVIERLKELAVEDGFPGLHCTLGMYHTPDHLHVQGRGRGVTETLEGDNSVFDRLTHYPYPYDWTRRDVYKVPGWCLHKKSQGAESRSDSIVGVVTAFDNTPRREFVKARLWISFQGERGTVSHFANNILAAFYYHACCYAEGGKNQFILVNAWNEWAEGMVRFKRHAQSSHSPSLDSRRLPFSQIMEPSDVYDMTFLVSLRQLKQKFDSCASAAKPFKTGLEFPDPPAYEHKEPTRVSPESRLHRFARLKGTLNSSLNHPLSHGGLSNFPDDTAKAILPMVLAFYAPNYHQNKLYDRLLGHGFTDWDTLRKSPTLNKKGFRIPRPTTLGYYDLRDTNIRKFQGQLARKYGVDGFVYHHYWFYDEQHPGPSIQDPLIGMLHDSHPDIPFCLHWVAENWTTTWHSNHANTTIRGFEGASQQVLQTQFFPPGKSDERISEHYKWLRQFFHHKKYVRVKGKPLFMVFKNVPGIHRVIARLKELAVDDGFPGLHCALGMYHTHDALFPSGKTRGTNETLENENAVFDRLLSYPFPYDWVRARRITMAAPLWCLRKESSVEPHSDTVIGIVASYDSTPLIGNTSSNIWTKSDGEKGNLNRFERNLWAALYYHTCCYPEGGKDQFILINAWNEWALGMAIEPSDVYGMSFLESIRLLKARFSTCANSFNTTLKSPESPPYSRDQGSTAVLK
jgi:hypothetical protein